MSLGHLPECRVAQIEPATVQPGPRYPVRNQITFPAIGLESAALIHTEIGIDRGDQLVLDACPAFPQQRQGVGVDRHAIPFRGGGGLHVMPAHYCASQINLRQHCRQEPL